MPSSSTAVLAPRRPSRPARKNLRLDQRKLDQARRLLGAKTETEAVETALDLLIFQREALDGLHRIAGSGIASDPYQERPPARRRVRRR